MLCESRIFRLLLLIVFLGFSASVLAQKPSNAMVIDQLGNWCSGDAAHSTAPFTSSQPPASCHPPNGFGKWYQFTATTPVVEVQLQTGGDKGSLQYPFLSVFDAGMKMDAAPSQ